MIGSTTRQAFLFYVPLAQQVSLLKDDLLDPLDELLDDPELVDLVRQRLSVFHSNRAPQHCPGPSSPLLRCKAPERMVFSRTGTRGPLQPRVPALYAL